MAGSRIAVIGGGTSCEHEVSLASAAAVTEALTGAGYAVEPLTIDRDGRWLGHAGHLVGLAGAVRVLGSCVAAVPMLHGPGGEDGTLAALCELAGVPYVGSRVRAGAMAMDKWATKLVAEAVGVRTAPGTLVTRARAAAGLPTGPLPAVVKPVSAGSSYGVSLVHDAQRLAAAVEAAFALDDRVLVEEVVHGREIDLAVLGRPDGTRTVAPPLEIVTGRAGFFDLATKYDGSARFLVPAPLRAAQLTSLREAALTVYDALGCAGVARVDFFLTDAGPVLNEVNTMPGFTSHSQVPRMFTAQGVSYLELLELLIADAVAAAGDRRGEHAAPRVG
ncbi:D-alanine--D-alanine ligase [Frankia sp. CNm7]|uniref:D-alanine--D-alanine ligase n=1 Tax=Frankia nepalensis TaxID=1836974 RepID=A0A937UNH9_9ACTN|nr:D-alanine--D-alanine ligase [Frankia nepalensis]MBL7498920.1 D-alanine--D-alanine ligase [Frankia nepalensis]MBL7513090.1 D-alanine--D-alanine ligase [Frankia nepalensis]MBL7521916.1 D-alanine--D-alanine ligase [Frankia nepalensis]MBL7628108.1 D-alanine--D-alanine ligase [Frankia nepalensis]